jgi:hypothetical protein
MTVAHFTVALSSTTRDSVPFDFEAANGSTFGVRLGRQGRFKVHRAA